MKIILLSGGSGKRLWPLSNDSRSKQFLKVIKDNNGQFESMVQRVKRQIQASNQCELFIATSKSQVEIVRNQLGNDVRLIVEPEKRDTFPAIALASTYLYSVVGTSLDEVVCVLPVDPFVEDRFFQSLKLLEDLLNKTPAEIALLGVKPTYPSEKYGYIVPSDAANPTRDGGFYRVSHFVEKPSEEKAVDLINQQAYWNCGVFAFKLDTMITILERKGISINYEELSKKYASLKKTSFDYEVLEQTKNIAFIPYEGMWKDLGTWNTLTDEMNSTIIGKGYVSEESNNTHLINELDIPVVILGVSNVVVATSPDGVLVSDKKASPQIKDVVKHFEQIPMYEEKSWGNYKILDYIKNEDEQILTRRLFIQKGKNTNYQYHSLRKQIWTVVSGKGILVQDGLRRYVKTGEVIIIEPDCKYAIQAEIDLDIIEVQIGREIAEDDTVILSNIWKEIVI